MIHLAIIPDGNRRWANAHGLPPWKGHEKSAENFEILLEWCRKSERISTLTFWTFSTENWSREPEEVKKLMEILEKYLYLKEKRKRFMENGVRFLHSGRKDRLPKSIRTLMEEMERETGKTWKFTLNLALDYGGKDEVIRAVNKLSGEEATEKNIRSNIDHPELPDIDLVIRTSGEYRTSNFALWTTAHAEWVFLDHHFPDFSEADLATALDEYDKRQRRFGR